MFNDLIDYFTENRYQEGCRDRDAGRLPTTQDSIYLNGYLSDRPKGLDDVVQYYSSLEEYLKNRHRH